MFAFSKAVYMCREYINMPLLLKELRVSHMDKLHLSRADLKLVYRKRVKQYMSKLYK